MASKYVAPHARKGEQARDSKNLKALAPTNFPSLGGAAAAPPPKNDWNGKRKFASLASEWKTADDDDKTRRQADKAFHERQSHAVVPRFCRIRPVDNEEHPEDDYEEDSRPPAPAPDDWTTVAKKERKPAKPAEDANYADQGNMWGGEGESMWGTDQPEEYKTYWDAKPIG